MPGFMGFSDRNREHVDVAAWGSTFRVALNALIAAVLGYDSVAANYGWATYRPGPDDRRTLSMIPFSGVIL